MQHILSTAIIIAMVRNTNSGPSITVIFDSTSPLEGLTGMFYPDLFYFPWPVLIGFQTRGHYYL